MTQIITTVILTALFVVGCSQGPSYSDFLLQAESQIYQHPDSVFLTLQHIESERDSMTADADRALYDLLYVEALHHCGLSTTYEPRITASHDFFEQVGDRQRMARTTLHHAIILYQKGESQTAVQQLKQVESLADDLDEPTLDWYLYSVLGDVNDNIGNSELTLHYYHKSLDAAKRCGNVEWQARSLNNIAQIFSKLHEADSVRHYVTLAKPIIQQTADETQASYLVNRAICELADNNVEAAKQLLLNSNNRYPTDHAARLLANIYENEGDTLRAIREWYQLTTSLSADVRIEAHQVLIGHLKRTNDTKRALEYSQRLNEFLHYLYTDKDRDALSKIQSQYDEQLLEKRQYRITIMLLSAIIILVALAITIVWYNRRRIDRLNTQFVENQQKYAVTRDELAKMRQEKEREERDNSRLIKDIVAQLHSLANHAKPADDETMNSLAQHTFSLYPELQILLSQLNIREQNIALLIKHNFLPTEIAVLINATPQSITNTRTRLLKRLFNADGGAKDFDTRIRDY